MIAMIAMISVPSSRPRTPNLPTVGFQRLVVKKFQIPVDSNAGRDSWIRKMKVRLTIARLTHAAPVAMPRNTRSPEVRRVVGRFGTSSGKLASVGGPARTPMP